MENGKNAILASHRGACVDGKDRYKCLKTHGLERNVLEGNACNVLVHRLAKCGDLKEARGLFDQLEFRDVISWTALIGGYAQHGHDKESLNCLRRMQLESLSPDSVTFSCALKACGNLEKGQEIHAQIIASGLIKKTNTTGNALICMYMGCGHVEKAKEVFDRLQVRNVISWTALIGGYAQCGYHKEALHCFNQMQLNGVSPNEVTFSCILKVCGRIRASDQGEEIHSRVVDEGLLGKSIILGNALVDMYAKCGFLGKAKDVFHQLPDRNLVSWTSLIGAYAQHGSAEEALHYFEQMQEEGLFPNSVTFLCVLKACGRIGFARMGQEIHAMIIKEGISEEDVVAGTALMDMYINCGMFEEAQVVFDKFPVWDVVLWNALIAGYAKCGLLKKAQEVFDESPVQDTISWNGLISGYVQHGYVEEAIKCFDQMQLEEFSADTITFACILKACGNVGSAYKGQKIHAQILKDGLNVKDMALGDALVDMYGNCGMLSEAQSVFNSLVVRDVVLWSALMTGYAQLGEDEIVHNLLNAMIDEGKRPDSVTFSILLNSCSHSGLVDRGQMYFEFMFTKYGIIPTLEHYVCLIDLIGRAGQLEKVTALTEQMPIFANITIWHSILGACQKWGNPGLGILAFESAIQLDQTDSAAYVSMRNIYGANGHAREVGMLKT